MSANVEMIRTTPQGQKIGLRVFANDGSGLRIGLTNDEARKLIEDLTEALAQTT